MSLPKKIKDKIYSIVNIEVDKIGLSGPYTDQVFFEFAVDTCENTATELWQHILELRGALDAVRLSLDGDCMRGDDGVMLGAGWAFTDDIVAIEKALTASLQRFGER